MRCPRWPALLSTLAYRKQGAPQPLLEKIFGSLFALGLVLVLFAPLLIVSIGNTLDNEPYKAHKAVMYVSLAPTPNPRGRHGGTPAASFSSFQLFQSSVVPADISGSHYKRVYTNCSSLVKAFSQEAVQVANFRFAESYWTIPNQVREPLIQLLKNSSTGGDESLEWRLHLSFEFHRRHIPQHDNLPLVVRANEVFIPLAQQNLSVLADMIDGRANTTDQLDKLDMSAVPSAFELGRLNVQQRVGHGDTAAAGSLVHASESSAESWSLQVSKNSSAPSCSSSGSGSGSSGLEFLLVCTPAETSTFFALVAGIGGLIGLYVSGVLVIGKFLSLYFQKISHRIMFEDLPQTTTLSNLVYAIHTCRELAASSNTGHATLGGGGDSGSSWSADVGIGEYELAQLQAAGAEIKYAFARSRLMKAIQVETMQVPAGLVVTVYEGSGFSGRSATYDAVTSPSKSKKAGSWVGERGDARSIKSMKVASASPLPPLAYLQHKMTASDGRLMKNPLVLEELLLRLLIRIYRNPVAIMEWTNIRLLRR